MDFIIENIYLLVLAAAGIVQWWKSTQEAKKERENPPSEDGYEFDEEELEEFIEQAERRASRPAVPPPLPAGPMPGVGRSPVPNLRRQAKEVVAPPLVATTTGLDEELARQAALAEQLQGLKQARKARPAKLVSSSRSAPSPVVATAGLRSRLANRRELRQAFVLKEILEKPIGLR